MVLLYAHHGFWPFFFWVPLLIFFALFWFGCFFGGFWRWRRYDRFGRYDRSEPEDVLKLRLARGELNEADYERLRDALRK